MLEIQEGRAVQLKNGDILTSSGMIYGTHGNNTVFLRSGSPNTVDLNQGEFEVFKKMVASGGLHGDALTFFEMRINSHTGGGLNSDSRQKIINLYNSRRGN